MTAAVAESPVIILHQRAGRRWRRWGRASTYRPGGLLSVAIERLGQEQEVVRRLRYSRDHQGPTEARPIEQGSGESWGERGGQAPGDVGDARSGGSLVRLHQPHDQGLPGG